MQPLVVPVGVDREAGMFTGRGDRRKGLRRAGKQLNGSLGVKGGRAKCDQDFERALHDVPAVSVRIRVR